MRAPVVPRLEEIEAGLGVAFLDGEDDVHVKGSVA